MLIPELPDYLTSLGGRPYIGLIIALFTLTAGASRPFSGKLTDTIGRVPVMAFGSLVCFVCGLLYPYLITVWGFLMLRLVHGFSTGTKPTATAAYVTDVVPAERRGEAMGTLGIFTATGMSIGPAIGSWLAESYSLNTMFYTSSGFALLSILILIQMPETLPVKQRFSVGPLRLTRAEIFDKQAFKPFMVMLLQAFGSGVVLTVVPALGTSVGLNNKGLFFTVYTVASLLIRLVLSRASDRHGRVPVLALSSVVLTISLVMLTFTGSAFLYFASAVVYGLAWGMNSPTIQAWTADLSDDATRGRAMATMYIALEAGIGLGAVLAGGLYTGLSYGIQASFGLAAALSLLCAGYLGWLWRNQAGQPLPNR